MNHLIELMADLKEEEVYARADAYGKDAAAAVNLCKQWIS